MPVKPSSFGALLGLPGTVVLLPASIGAMLAGGALALDSVGRGDFQAAIEFAPLLLWGLSGIIGLLGFWVWFFMRDQAGRAARLTTASVCVGWGRRCVRLDVPPA